MKMNRLFYAAMIATSIVWMACDDDDKDNNEKALNTVDDQFVEQAALSNLAEVELGTIAVQKATDSLVKAFGQHMITEHNTAQDELEDIADDYRDVNWPQSLDQQHQQIRDQLLTMTGYAFDSMYMASQVADHQKTLTAFDTEINSGQETRVKNYANKYRPHIAEHLQMADSIFTVIQTNQETPINPAGN